MTARALRSFALSLFVCLLAGAFASAQNTANMNSSKNGLTTQDEHFLDHVAKDSRGEVELGQLVESKTTNSQVKEFAQKMVHDHTMLDNQLTAFMKNHGMTTPAGITAEQQQLKDQLEKLSGAQLDKTYMQAEVKGHGKAVQLVSTHAQNEKELKPSHPGVAEVAQESLPVLQDHLQLAEKVAGEIGAGTQSAAAR